MDFQVNGRDHALFDQGGAWVRSIFLPVFTLFGFFVACGLYFCSLSAFCSHSAGFNGLYQRNSAETPYFVQLLLVFYGGPSIAYTWPYHLLASSSAASNIGAYMSEAFAALHRIVHWNSGQYEAARSLGLAEHKHGVYLYCPSAAALMDSFCRNWPLLS